ncbi:MAG: hypothetical protein AB7C91_01780 [Sphaerochaeta sp.]|jgi:hypothetical protein|uniref:hypothetical protein n=1 Tax=Sphaerochaeta sp. TaxID=1972642 RepID=UPI002FC8735B
MLQTRRLLAFSSRVHTYTLLLYLFFFVVYLLSSFFSVQQSFIELLQFLVYLISWTSLLFGFWILVFSVIVWASDRVFPFSVVVLTLLRMLVVFALSLIVAILEQVITKGVVIS